MTSLSPGLGHTVLLALALGIAACGDKEAGDSSPDRHDTAPGDGGEGDTGAGSDSTEGDTGTVDTGTTGDTGVPGDSGDSGDSGSLPDADGDVSPDDDDCDDTDATVYPGADELCNGIDDDCDGAVDGDWTVPGDHDTIGAALEAAADGELICVDAGTYTEQLDFGGQGHRRAQRLRRGAHGHRRWGASGRS